MTHNYQCLDYSAASLKDPIQFPFKCSSAMALHYYSERQQTMKEKPESISAPATLKTQKE